jgi:hypothetical protein
LTFYFNNYVLIGINCLGVKSNPSKNELNQDVSDKLSSQYRSENNSFIENQYSAASSSLVSSATSPTSPSSPERSTITPDTTKELLENGEEECISVDDNVSEGKVDTENDTSAESSSIPKQLPCSSGSITKDGITVELVGQHLWKKFHKLGTEMIITKAGR